VHDWSKPGSDVIGNIERAAKVVSPRGCVPQRLVATRSHGVLSEAQVEDARFLTDIERHRYKRALVADRRMGVLLVDEEGGII
jgi:hypothetical protein